MLFQQHLDHGKSKCKCEFVNHKLPCTNFPTLFWGAFFTRIVQYQVTVDGGVQMGLLSTRQNLFSVLKGGFYTWDIVENRFWADGRYAKIMNVDFAELDRGLPAESFLETVHPDDRADVIERMKLTVIDRQPFEIAYRVKRVNTFVLVKDYGQCMRSIEGYATLFTGIVFEAFEAKSNATANNSNHLGT